MKMIILTLALAAILPLSAAAQVGTFACVNRDGSPVPADSITYKVGAGNFNWLPVSMPIAGKCHVEFASYDDRDDAETILMDAAGQAIGVRPQIKGDVEVMFLDLLQWENYLSGRRVPYALWSSKRVVGGSFDVKLPAGESVLIINNRYSMAKKSVNLTLGQGDAPPQTVAPYFAPSTRETNQTQTNQDKPPRLKKSQRP